MASIMLFVTKYFFRTLHMASFAFFFGNFTYDAYFGERTVQKREINIFTHSATAVLFISGIINMIILIKENKYVKNLAYAFWKYILISKVILTIAMTPLLEKIVPSNMIATNLELESKTKPIMYLKIRLGLLLFIFLSSPFARFFREYYMKKSTDASTGKVSTD
jgi:hypothetical protein